MWGYTATTYLLFCHFYAWPGGYWRSVVKNGTPTEYPRFVSRVFQSSSSFIFNHGSKFHRVLTMNVSLAAFTLTFCFFIGNQSRSFLILMYGIEAYWLALTPQPQQSSSQMVRRGIIFGRPSWCGTLCYLVYSMGTESRRWALQIIFDANNMLYVWWSITDVNERHARRSESA